LELCGFEARVDEKARFAGIWWFYVRRRFNIEMAKAGMSLRSIPKESQAITDHTVPAIALGVEMEIGIAVSHQTIEPTAFERDDSA
jgi:hypothetical protein